MGAYDQAGDPSDETYGERGREAPGDRRRRGGPQDRRERASGGGPAARGPGGDDSAHGSPSGSHFDEAARRRAEERMHDAETGQDDGDWA
jgi:hypothetical protein